MEDTAWHPVGKAELQSWSPAQRAVFKIFLGSPLKLWASVGHWWLWHFNLDLYTPKQRPRVRGQPRPSACSVPGMPTTAGPVLDASGSVASVPLHALEKLRLRRGKEHKQA